MKRTQSSMESVNKPLDSEIGTGDEPASKRVCFELAASDVYPCWFKSVVVFVTTFYNLS